MSQRLSRLGPAICGEERSEVTGVGRRELEMKAGPGRLLGGHGLGDTDVELGSEVGAQGPHRGDAAGAGGEPGSWPSCPSDKDTPTSGGADRRWNDR